MDRIDGTVPAVPTPRNQGKRGSHPTPPLRGGRAGRFRTDFGNRSGVEGCFSLAEVLDDCLEALVAPPPLRTTEERIRRQDVELDELEAEVAAFDIARGIP